MHQLPKMFSIGEIAEMFGRSPRTIRDWVTHGLLQPVRVGRSLLISKAQVDALLTGLPTAEYDQDTAEDQTCCQQHAGNSKSTDKQFESNTMSAAGVILWPLAMFTLLQCSH